MATTEQTVPPAETHAFQAEIRQLLDIVVHSLYTNKEVFLRELVSNASDALEKIRHEILTNPDLPGKDDPRQITITADAENKTLTIADTGIGMTREELSQNLGTIAHSGTKQFMTRALEAAKNDVNLIGQFGVGFYSAFMVGKKVTVETRSFHADSQGWAWESDGTGTYSIRPAEDAPRGTRITIELKDDAHEFAEPSTVKDTIRRFSNFVPFPIQVDGETVNTVQAIWKLSKNDITEEQYTEFYKFIANAWDEPRYRLHFSADAPLAINALLFVPKSNMEQLGLGRMEPGVDLYCKKVLIEKHPENLLPEWMRFVKGVIDSDDLPLNISRETMQDSSLVRKLSKVITGRFLKHLNEEATKDTEKYAEFYEQFARFLKEGITTDHAHREEIAKLLRFETSALEAGKTCSLDEYITRMPEDQKAIYYINGASREAIEAGPYVEALRARNIEVIYTYDPIDDFVFDHLGTYQEKPLKSADRGDLDLPEIENENELAKEDADALAAWLKEHYGERVGTVRPSKRLVNNPALIVTDGMMTATMQRLMQAMNKDRTPLGTGLTLEINPANPVIRRLHQLKTTDTPFAQQLADQLLDNTLLAAGLLNDPRAMVERLNKLLEKAAGGGGNP